MGGGDGETKLIGVEKSTNAELIRKFEEEADASAPFHHADHVRLAFAYLCQNPVLQAMEKFSAALKRYASARGKTQLYHETITYAYLFLIRERMERGKCRVWEDFERCNPDLLAGKTAVLERYYKKETLNSELARSVFVLPEKHL
jgi:hypothetical protein